MFVLKTPIMRIECSLALTLLVPVGPFLRRFCCVRIVSVNIIFSPVVGSAKNEKILQQAIRDRCSQKKLSLPLTNCYTRVVQFCFSSVAIQASGS